MAAPAGVSSGSAPEPVVPEGAVTEPTALASAVPEPSEPAPGENAAAIAVPEPSEPAPGENAAASAIPEPSEPDPGENAAASAEPEPSEPGPGGNAAANAIPEPSEPGPGETMAASAEPEPSEPPANERVREGRRVGWLVTAGVAIVLIAAAAAVGVLAVATHGFRPKTVVTYRPAAVFTLRAGDCIDSSPNGLSVTILSCATPHEAEVFATFSLTGADWPGSAAVQQQASDGCANRIASYLNPQLLNAGLSQEYVYPNQDAWKAGVRTVVCEVSAASGPLSGSVRQGG